MGRRRYILAIVVTSVILMSLAIYLAPRSIFIFTQAGLMFTISLYNDRGERVYLSRDMGLYVQVFATTVEGSRFGDMKIEILRGRVNGSIIVLKPEGKFGEVVREWVEYIERRGLSPKTSSSVQINLWVVNTTLGEIIARFSRYYAYEPVAIASGRSITIEITMVIKSAGNRLQLLHEHQNRIDFSTVRLQDVNCIFTYWERLWYVGPENFTWKPYTIYDPRDATYYMKMPLIAAIMNHYALSPISASISITATYKTGWSASIGLGYQLREKGLGASATIYKAGSVREDYVYFYDMFSANPGEIKNIYVWARPIAEFYREIEMNVCIGSATPTGYEKLDTYVKSVRIIDKYGSKYYDGGIDNDLPDWLYQWFYDNSITSEMYIGWLGPNDSRAIPEIIKNYVDTCGADFEISIPVGAMAASLLSSSPVLAGFVASMSASMGYSESLTLIIGGGIKNTGSHWVDTYLRFINLKYKLDPPWRCSWCSPCYYNVPISMIFIIL